VLATFNRGVTWLPRETGLPADQTISDLLVSPTDPLTAYLSVDQASGGRLFRTSDGGVTWVDATGNLAAGIRGMSLAIDFNAGKGYLGTDDGVYSTADGGATWVHESIGLPRLAVYDVQIDALNGYIVAATHGRGIWRALLSGGNALTPGPLAPASREWPRRGPSRMPAQPIP
jgi:hypothetical protein